MSPEIALITALCRTPLTVATRQRVDALLAAAVDWDSVLARAASWQVEPVVMSNLRSLFSDAIPLPVLERIAVRERESRGMALARTLMMLELIDNFERASIPVIVLKGPAVAVTAYGDPSLRTLGDMDLLVSRDNLLPARELLTSLGFAPDYDLESEHALAADQHALEFSSSRAKVELHWALLSRHLRLDFEAAEIWASAQSVNCAGKNIRVLAPGVQFVFLCAHGAKHEWMSVRWICDVAQLSLRLDADGVEKVLSLASRSRSRRILALGLRVAEAVLGERDHPFAPDEIVGEADTRHLVEVVLGQLGLNAKPATLEPKWLARLDPSLRTLVFWSRTRENRVDQVASIARVLLVPSTADEGLPAMRWIRRPLRLAARAFRRAHRHG